MNSQDDLEIGIVFPGIQMRNLGLGEVQCPAVSKWGREDLDPRLAMLSPEPRDVDTIGISYGVAAVRQAWT